LVAKAELIDSKDHAADRREEDRARHHKTRKNKTGGRRAVGFWFTSGLFRFYQEVVS
jgi:hypothetical protein